MCNQLFKVHFIRYEPSSNEIPERKEMMIRLISIPIYIGEYQLIVIDIHLLEYSLVVWIVQWCFILLVIFSTNFVPMLKKSKNHLWADNIRNHHGGHHTMQQQVQWYLCDLSQLTMGNITADVLKSNLYLNFKLVCQSSLLKCGCWY